MKTNFLRNSILLMAIVGFTACLFDIERVSAQSTENSDVLKPFINIAECANKGSITNEGIKTTLLSNKEIHCYGIELEKNQYAHFLVQQEGIDVFLQLFDEKGVPLTGKIDSPNGGSEYEPVSIAAAEKSRFVLVVSTEDAEAKSRNYSIKIDEFREAKRSDFKYMAAEPIFLQGKVEELAYSNPAKAKEYYDRAWSALTGQEDVSIQQLQKELSDSQLNITLQLLNRLGAIYKDHAKNLEKAKYYFGLMRDFSNQRDSTANAFAHFNLGDVYNQAGDYENALAEYERAEQTLPENFVGYWAHLLSRKGEIYWFRQIDFDKAEQAYRRLAELYINKVSDPDKGAETYVLMGIYYYDSGLKAKAKEFYQKAIDLKGVKSPTVKAHAHQNLGVLLATEGNAQKALEEYGKAEEFYRESMKLHPDEDFSEAFAYILQEKAAVYLKIDLDRALEYAGKALEISAPAGKIKYPDAAAFEHLYISKIYYEKYKKEQLGSQFETAIEKAKTAIGIWNSILESELCRQQQNARECKVAKRGIANASNNLGHMLYEKGEKEEALKYLNTARKIQKDINVLYGQIYTLINIGKTESDLSHYDEAKKLYDEAREISQKTSDRFGEAAALFQLAELAVKTGNLEDAEKHLSGAKKLNENLRLAIEDEELRSAYFSTTGRLYELYIDVLMQLDKKYPKKGYLEKALEISDSSKARSLYDVLSAAKIDIRQDINPALAERERKAQDKIALLIAQKRLALDTQSQNAARVQSFDRDIDLAREELQNTRVEIQRSNSKFAELANPRPVTVSEIQKELPGEMLVLHYSVGESNTYLWTFSSSEDVRGYIIPVGRKALDQLVLDLVKNIKYQESLKVPDEKKYSEYKDLSRTLSKILFKDVAENLGSRRLLIVADGSLQYVPFNGLPDLISSSNTGWEPMVINHEISTIPSMSVFVALKTLIKQRAEMPPNLMLGFIDPEYEPRDDNCKNIEKNTDVTLSSGFPLKNLGFGKTLLSNLQATAEKSRQKGASTFFKCWDVNRQNATRKDNANYRYILYYAHGKADDSDPAASGIYLSRYNRGNELQSDFFLGMNDIYNLRLSADVVFLSACETALGKDIKGEGLVGITRGFMYAGAFSVISSLWKAREYQTRILVEQFFYKVLVEGQTPNSALRQIQIQMWQKKNPPYYWAGFQFQGI